MAVELHIHVDLSFFFNHLMVSLFDVVTGGAEPSDADGLPHSVGPASAGDCLQD